ncbi:MAG: transcriptional repressor LexA [Acidobacteriota bacterium]
MGKRRLLTKEQVIDAIHRWVVEHGVPPTIEELRKLLNVGSTRTVLRYLRWLEDEGDIERWVGARGLRALKSSSKGVETKAVPIAGQAPAGQLMTAEQNIEGWVRLPQSFLRPPSAKFFLLRVRGDSMNRATVENEKIEDKDLVLVRQQATADSGAIIVALVDGEATIKRLTCGPGYCLLKPVSSNPKYSPIILDKDLVVQGVVCRVLKQGSELLSLPEHGE